MAVCCRICLIHLWRTFVLHGERDSDAYGTYHITLTRTCYPHCVVHSHLEMNCLGVVLISFTAVCLVIAIFVRFVAHHGVFCRRMLSDIGCNVQYCYSRYNASLVSFTLLNKSSVFHYARAAASADVWNRSSCFYFRTTFYKVPLLYIGAVHTVRN